MKHIQLFEDFLNEGFKKFADLENAIRHHEDGNPYYDRTKLINIYNGLKSSDQTKAKKQYSEYFGVAEAQVNVPKSKLPESVFEAFINEENWSSSPNKPIIHEKELASFFEGLIKFNSASKNIIKQYNLQPSIEVEGYHFTDNTGAIYFNYKLGHSAVKLKVGLGSIGETNPILLIKSWSGEGALSKPNELRTPIALKANVMSELTLAMIQKEIKKAAPVFNKYLNNTIDKWANGVAAQKAFYKDRKGSSGVGDLA